MTVLTTCLLVSSQYLHSWSYARLVHGDGWRALWLHFFPYTPLVFLELGFA